MIGWGHFFQVPGLSHQVSGSGIQVQVQEFCHLSFVIDSALDSAPRHHSEGNWRPRNSWGMHFRVTGDSHWSQPTRSRPFGFQLPASGSRLSMAGMPSPEWLMP